MKQLFILISILILSIAFTFGQTIAYDGTITDLDSQNELANVTVTVYSGGSKVTSSQTSANGKYLVKFSPGKKYTIKYTKPGYVTKIIEIDVVPVIGEDLPSGGKIFPPINLDLFKERPGVDFSFLETEPVVKWSLDQGERMNYNQGQMKQMKKKIENKLKAAQDQEKEQDAEYNKLITEADNLYKEKKFEAALDKYVAALQIPGKQKEKHPNDRLLQIEELLQQQQQEQLANEQESQAYLNLITAADNFAKDKSYVKAIAKYNEALEIKSDEQYPKDRIAELKEEKAVAAKREKYDKIVKRADGFFKQSSWQAARDTYQEAGKILPKEEYPKEQLAIIKEKLEEQSKEKEKKDQYNNAVTAADEFYDNEEYVQAIEKYQEALEYESAATYPAQRIKMAQEIVDQEKEEAEKLENFNQLVAEADVHVNKKEYESAVTKYEEALSLIEVEEVQTKLEEAKNLLASQKEQEEKQQQIEALMLSAEEKMGNEAYADALTDFEGVLAIDETHPAAIAGKEKAQSLLADKQEQQAKKEEFDGLVAEADKAFDTEKWEEAKSKYLAAQAIFDDKEHVNNRIIEVELKIENQNLNEEIETLMTSAGEKVDNEDFTGAIADYEAVLQLKDDYTQAIEGKKNAEKLMAEKANQEEQEAAFNEIVSAADKAYDEENWEEAKGKYLAAKAIFEDRTHVNNRLEKVELALEKAQEKEENLAKIQTLLDEAEALKPDNKWTEIIQKYEKALAIDEERTDVADLLAAAKESKEEWEAQQSLAEKEEEFVNIVSEADKAYDNENWQEAKDKYLAAQAIFDDKEHVNSRVDEVNTLLAEQEKEAADKEKIKTLLAAAETLKGDNQWSDVVAKYEEALAIDKEREDVAEMLAAAKESQKEWEAEQSQEEQFTQLKQAGDDFMAVEAWQEAKTKYEAALEINADEEIDNNLVLIEEKIAEEAALAELNEEYQTAMNAAEELANDEKYEEALSGFKAALAIKEEDETAKSRIKDMEEQLEALAQQEAQGEKYAEAMKAGNKAMKEEDYAAAVKAFDDALEEIPEDAEAIAKKEEARNKIKALQAKEEEYNAFVESALAKYDEAIAADNNVDKLKEAKSIFESAQNVRPESAIPQEKIIEINELLRQIEESKAANNEAKEEEYQNQLQLAKVAAQDDKYQNAIEYLKEAQQLKPEEEFPAQEIKKYQAILKQKAAEADKEIEYAGLIDKADVAFNKKNYQESIELYNEALSIKKSEEYPKEQIAKAEVGIKNEAKNQLDKKYQNYINKGDDQFMNESYEKALESYKLALSIKENDIDAQDKIDETQQVLDNLKKKNQEAALLKEQFNQVIAAADNLFDGEEFLQAKAKYQEALNIDPNDAYANQRVKLSAEKAAAKKESSNKVKYEQFIARADKHFKNKEYEQAISEYERAESVQRNAPYPKSQITKSKAALYALSKAEGSVEDLGEQSNISILEGAALLEQGEIQRERMKQQAVSDRLRKFEGEEADRSRSDFEERLAFENEVEAIKDRRDQSGIENIEMKRQIADNVDSQLFVFEQQSAQIHQYKAGELSRTRQALVFVEDDFDQEKADYRELHKASIERIKQIENDRNDQTTTEREHHDVRVTATNQELAIINDRYDEFSQVNHDFQQETEAQVNAIELARDAQIIDENNQEYDRVLQLQDEADLARNKVAESMQEKEDIQRQLKENVAAYEAHLDEKLADEASQVHQQQIVIDEQITAAQNQYEEAQEGKDENRLNTVETVKEIDQDQVDQAKVRAENQRQKAESNLDKIETVENLQTEQALKNVKDLGEIDREVKSRESAYERTERQLKETEDQEHQRTREELLHIEKREEIAAQKNDDKSKETYENLKREEIRIENKNHNIEEEASKKKQETQEYVDALENNELKFSETIANEIGDDYPEGVTQENYVRKDSKGIPVRIVTRRIVVTEGRGDVYIRIQSRNGLTYSKNGQPISEQNWINGTANANLEKHY